VRWFLVAVLALAACKKEPQVEVVAAAPVPAAKPAVVDRDPAFWKWIAANVEGLKAVKTGREPVTDQLSQELEKVEPGLVFELGIGREPFELIISADGKKELFPVVKRLVAAAPEIPGTKVIAFRPRKDIDGFSMQIGEGKLAGKDLLFVAGPDLDRKGLIAVDLFVQGMKSEDDEARRNAAFMLLEASVGEFDLETKIGGIEIKPAPDKADPALKPLKDLPATLDSWK
jgi:hypothetical protein